MANVLPGAGAGALFLALLTTEHFPPWVTWHAEGLVLAATLGCAILALLPASGRTGRAPILIPRAVLPLALVLALTLWQLASGVLTYAGDALVVGMYVGFATICAAAGFHCGRTEPQAAVSAVAWALVAASVASALIAFAQVFELWPAASWILRMPELRRPGANLGQPNHLALLLVTGVGAVAFLHSIGRMGRLGGAALVMLLLSALAATESRAGVLALLALVVWWQWRGRPLAPQVPAAAGWIIAFVAGLLFLGWPQLLGALDLLAEDAANRLTGARNSRSLAWMQLLEASLQHPWAGWGMLEVAEAHNGMAHKSLDGFAFSYSHNLLLDLAIWFGWPAAVALSVLAAWWCWNRAWPKGNPVSWFALAALAVLATQSMLEFPFAFAYFLGPVMFLLGVMEAERAPVPLLRIARWQALAVVAAMVALLVWSAAEYLAIEEDFRVVRFESMKIGKTASEHRMPEVVLLTQLGAVLAGSRIELRPDMPPAELAQLRKLAMRYPWGATQYRYAVALGLNGEPGEAVRQLQVLRAQRGEKMYMGAKAQWMALAQESHPQLANIQLP